jgi:hypothetical protein
VRFHERQYFRQLWLWLLLTCALIAMGVSAHRDESGRNVISLGGFVVLMVLTAYAHLDVTVDSQAVRIVFRPFHLRGKRIPLRDIGEVRARAYSPIGEYGGWGIRVSFRNGKAYTVGGDEGVQLVLKDGTRILIGSRRSDELEAAIKAVCPALR